MILVQHSGQKFNNIASKYSMEINTSRTIITVLQGKEPIRNINVMTSKYWNKLTI
jgi:hypothetical protein